jgi:hypothetical protein
MSQRVSGYRRQELDSYQTPSWVTTALLPHLPAQLHIWEPAAGSGQMAQTLAAGGHTVVQSDITQGRDFLKATANCTAIVTNPPYALAVAFIEKALQLTQPAGLVAMLLRTDFDHAKTRQHLFADCSAFAKKIVLTRRIVWFDGPKAAPSFNHAWYLWNHTHRGPPALAYDRSNTTMRHDPPL